ncbi:hypothetical protein K4K56_007141 [Colletotrichum sp. SAR 10_98]|nr:hypothetical protein K4K56_007141 [Colletotrichum sp. SAR 10_98]
MDDATLQLVLQLQQGHLKELRHEARGCNNKDGFLLDADLAFGMYQEELSFLETFVIDRELSQRFNEEEEADEEDTDDEDIDDEDTDDENTDEEEDVGQAEDGIGETENRYDDVSARFPTPSCRCHNEFCYLCLAEWKTYDCDQWDGEDLLDAYEEDHNAYEENYNAAHGGIQ